MGLDAAGEVQGGAELCLPCVMRMVGDDVNSGVVRLHGAAHRRLGYRLSLLGVAVVSRALSTGTPLCHGGENKEFTIWSCPYIHDSFVSWACSIDSLPLYEAAYPDPCESRTWCDWSIPR